MREIKFRAWWKSFNKMLCPAMPMLSGAIQWDSGYDAFPGDDFVLMQLTGLYDKNGKEIWEGDVVKWPSNYQQTEYYLGKVRWTLGHWDIHDDMAPTTDFLEEWHRECEVIGNIWENPELTGEVVEMGRK